MQQLASNVGKKRCFSKAGLSSLNEATSKRPCTKLD
jgi:hypothetical protein